MKVLSGKNTAITNTAILLFDLAMLFTAAALAQRGSITFDGVLTATLGLFSSFGPTVALANLGSTLQNTFAAGNRVLDILDESPLIEETATGKTVEFHGAAAQQVTFSYGAEEILSNVSAEFPAGSIVGITGRSGSGKSTLLKLLMRYWDPQRGQVTLSGTPLPQIDVHARRRIQAMMSQETHLFDGTIRENLLIALPESEIRNGGAAGVLDARLREALAKASVLDLIDSLPDGLDTQVGELGDRLSEGERQRIGLARVFLRNADLVLFDEPTSRLDALNEAIILRSIHELSKSEQNADKGQDVAVVLVSHRESAMRVADAVLNL